ncbi:TonB-dependent receptor [Flavobacterium kingsejongi]|uniref:TonB-dependent receptor n=1 Tax=Flavobacterium kingsejongi TaxID=1678728 RepID=A0A2S1LQ57_9FLAO|nr:TonB-dependent receptor [Flavobacterium kingsejongi]AWG25887.1 TonB-dependent receptor [Flavobacterium kingsejongi]
MKATFTLFFICMTYWLQAQTTLSGKVVDEKGLPVYGANVFLEGAYDGATTAENGTFEFTTEATGPQTLIISFLAYETSRVSITVEEAANMTLKLKSAVNTLDAVMINAGSFEAGDNARVSALKPLDIVTTAGSAGNIIAALQTLPGNQVVGESGKLFVRGGEADETQTYIDGIRVAQPYGASTNNLPTRGRFSPFLFNGITFTTGGYSAEYGEALSSVLLLNTIDEPVQEQTDISVMSVGAGLSKTKKWEQNSLTFNTSYIDLAPYQAVMPQNADWNRAYRSFSGESVYRHKTEAGLYKLYAAFDHADFDINQFNVNQVEKMRVDMNNNNVYVNGSYKGYFGSNWLLTTGLSYGYNQNKIGLDANRVQNAEHASHLKFKLRKTISERFKLNFGADYFYTNFSEDYTAFASNSYQSGYTSNIIAAYTEADVFFSKKLAAKIGFRTSQNELLQEFTVSPRLSLAYKTGKYSQFSTAYGTFVQAPKADYLKYASDLTNEKTQHYLVNYQYNEGGKTFRAEAYYKKYNDLVHYDTPTVVYNSVFRTNGSGYAQGLDLFWRDNKTVKNMDYWISYSYIDTKRDFRNYPKAVMPNFVAHHNFSVVGKYWVEGLKSQFGATYTFSSGRPYNDPNTTDFMASKTKSYNNLSLSCAYLLSAQKILYFSVSNVLGLQNVYGYDYATAPNAAGVYNRQAVVPTADRSIFIGFFWTISADKKTNQLENL